MIVTEDQPVPGPLRTMTKSLVTKGAECAMLGSGNPSNDPAKTVTVTRKRVRIIMITLPGSRQNYPQIEGMPSAEVNLVFAENGVALPSK